MLRQQVHQAGVALDPGIPLAFLPSPTLGLPMRLWEIGEAPPHLHSPSDLPKYLKGLVPFLCAGTTPSPKHTLNGLRTRNALASFKGSGGYYDLVKAAEHNGFRKAAWGGLKRLLDFPHLCAVPSERQPDRRWLKASDLGWICQLLFACGTHLLGGNHCKSVSSLGSLRPWWTFTWWCGSNFYHVQWVKKAFSWHPYFWMLKKWLLQELERYHKTSRKEKKKRNSCQPLQSLSGLCKDFQN